jgi:hypothetical protein
MGARIQSPYNFRRHPVWLPTPHSPLPTPHSRRPVGSKGLSSGGDLPAVVAIRLLKKACE